MAEQAISLRDNQQAIAHYNEAMKFAQGDHVIMAAYARLCMQVRVKIASKTFFFLLKNSFLWHYILAPFIKFFR